MSDRAQQPIPVRVRHRRNRLMFTLPITSLITLLIGNAPIMARAQAQPADPQTPVPATPATPAPAGQATPAAPTTPAAPDPNAQTPDAQPPVAPRPRTILIVKVVSTEQGLPPVQYAVVDLTSDTERPRDVMSPSGIVTFADIDDGVYTIRVRSPRFPETKPQTVTVPPNVTTKITIFISPPPPIVIKSKGEVDFLDSSDYSISYTRDNMFLKDFPFDAGNHQDLNSELLSIPGLAYDSGNNYFIRGESAVGTSITMDGILLPPALQGRAATLYSGTTVDSFQAIIGNFAPEFTGSGMALNLTSLPYPQYGRYVDVAGMVGSDSVTEDDFTMGAAGGYKRGTGGQGTGTRQIGGAPVSYVISLGQHFTDDAVDAPQQNNQNIENHGESDVAFGKVRFAPQKDTSIEAMINYSFGRTDMADRTGLSEAYASTGQGYGYAGAFTNGTYGSQADESKADQQVDYNLLSLVKLNHTLQNGGKFVVAFGTNETSQDTDSNTPLALSLIDLPGNYSTEYKPFINTDYQNAIFQADYTAPAKNFHQYKAGVAIQAFTGNEAYQLVPTSQYALDALYALDPRLAPSGGTVGTGTDTLNFPIYNLGASAMGSDVPVLEVHRTGTYAAGYVQDTWQFRSALLFNYGLRVDSYSSSVTSQRYDPEDNSVGEYGDLASVSSTVLEPRINGVLEFPQGGSGPKFLRFLGTSPTLARFGYNRLFAAPGMDQGNFIGDQANEDSGGTQHGTAAVPQTTDQLDLNIERQIGLRGKLRIGFYDKQISDYLESEQLINGLQNDLSAIFNQGSVDSDGTEITYELMPGKNLRSKDSVGIHAFVSFEDSTTHPSNLQQFDNDGWAMAGYFNPNYHGPFAPYVDGDQSDTLSFGISKTSKDGSIIGLSGYYGTGLYDSAIREYYLPERDSSTRQGYSQINLKYDSGPRFFQKTTSLQLEISNLFNTQERIDYFGTFDGTRFQQGIGAYVGFVAHL